jgi:nucleoside-diphosphate-sugar epimerase
MVPLFIRVDGVNAGPIRGFDLADHFAMIDGAPHRFQEVISAGTFQIIAAASLTGNGRLVVVRQVGVYGLPTRPVSDAPAFPNRLAELDHEVMIEVLNNQVDYWTPK